MSEQFTGRHFLMIIAAFFAVIIGVNVTMAVYANRSWTGFVVRNSYVAGLEFNRKAREYREQMALGWHTGLEGGDGTLRFAIADRDGRPVKLKTGSATFRRPVSDAQDTTLALAPDADGALTAPFALADGVWIVEIEADAGRQLPWRETHRIVVKNGAFE